MAEQGDAPRSGQQSHLCPCCAGSDWHSRWPGFRLCCRCGLLFFEANLTPDEIQRLYGDDYFHGREYMDYHADKPALTKTLAQHLQVVRRLVPAGGRLLEVGCAYGYFLELAAPFYPRSVGVDLSSAAVAEARRRGFDAREGDLLDVALDGAFDAVCLWDTVEHLSQPEAVLRRGVALLKPGGCLCLSTGDLGSWLARVQGRRWRQIHPPTHLFYFTRASLRALCGRLGLEEMQLSTVRVYRRVRSALEALARFHPRSLSGRSARMLLRVVPRCWLDFDLPLNLGDTVRLVARKPGRLPRHSENA
jgi:SAM-dependent methyltransferase